MPSMANFMGGSAFAMVQQISEGYILVTERTFKRLKKHELDKLRFELDRLMRSIRADQPDLEDQKAVKLRNRKIQRLKTTHMMMRSYRKRYKI